jgi:hypothetical protein
VTLALGGERSFVVDEARGARFSSYVAKVPGGQQRFWHLVYPIDNGRSRVTPGHTIDGPLWPIFGNLFGRVIRGYLPQAAEQLVAEAEHTPGKRGLAAQDVLPHPVRHAARVGYGDRSRRTRPDNAKYGRVGFEATGSFEGYVPGSVIITMGRPARR